MKNFQDILKELNACSLAREWASDKTIEQVVAECHRGDWLIWLASKLHIDHRQLMLAEAYCANTVRHLMKDERSTKAIDVAIAYGEGRASQEELKDAAYAAYDASVAAAADYAANQMLTADICRKHIGQEIIELVNKQLSK